MSGELEGQTDALALIAAELEPIVRQVCRRCELGAGELEPHNPFAPACELRPHRVR